jgi:predicted metal-dependent enzyme (double-stranded beta helix superfamily)
MDPCLERVVADCRAAAQLPSAQDDVIGILDSAARDSAVGEAIAALTDFQSLEDLAIHRSDKLTVLAGSLPPGFRAAPHNHNIWSVVAVCGGQEDNRFFERDGDGLRQVGEASIIAPGVLANDPEVIHAIGNPLEVPLLALHAYGGDLFSTPRSNWDPDTHREIPFEWNKVKSTEDS